MIDLIAYVCNRLQENTEINVQISSLLSHLSLFAFESCSHAVLEYLIRRYKVHEMNADALIKSMIVAHDTKVYSIYNPCSSSSNPLRRSLRR